MTPDLAEAVRLLQAGELVAFPTETVYGLGADAANPDAVAKIYAAKGRPSNHPLIVHLPGAAHLESWAREIPPVAWELAEAFWPGPLTMILKRADGVPDAVTGGQDTVGVRVPAHPLALEFLRAYAQAGGGKNGKCGVAAPSANKFGRISPTEASHVRDELGSAVALVLDGGHCEVGIESTIVDLSSDDAVPRILRPGHITAAQIEAVIGIAPETPSVKPATAPRVSGSLAAHYAPRTPLRLVDAGELPKLVDELNAQGQHVGLLMRRVLPVALTQSLCLLPDKPEGFARGLYSALRELDRANCDVILVESIPEDPLWAAIGDRLKRAACGSGADVRRT